MFYVPSWFNVPPACSGLTESNIIPKFCLFQIAARVAQSIFIGQIVAAFYVEGVDRKKGYLAASLMTVCTFLEAFIHHPLFMESLRTGMDVRVALSALVYNKVNWDI